MTKRGEAAVAFLLGLTLTSAADVSARVLAQVRVHTQPHLYSDAAPVVLFRVVPAILVAGACLHAVVFHSRRALYFVLCCTLPAYAFWSYLGEFGFLSAIAVGRWTAAALSSGLAALASIIAVMFGIPLAFFLASRLERRLTRRLRPSSVAAKRTNQIVAPSMLSDGGSTFACSECGATVNFGASQCTSCDEPFEYQNQPTETAE